MTAHLRLTLCLSVALAAPAWSASSTAEPVLRCQVRYASETFHLEARPTSTPYDVAPHDIGGRFRFKAVVVGAQGVVDHIALYAYDMAVPQAPVLIHQVRYQAPLPIHTAIPGLTGWNHVYSSYLGREMVYGCALSTSPSPVASPSTSP